MRFTRGRSAPNSTWTDERIERLKVLVGKGYSGTQIAQDLGGVTRNAVVGKVLRLGMQLGMGIAQQPGVGRLVAYTPAGQAPPKKVRNYKPVDRVVKPVPPVATPKAPPTLRIIDPSVSPRILADCGSHHCRWPLNDPGPGRMDETLLCAADKEAEFPYCAGHRALAKGRAATAQEVADAIAARVARELRSKRAA